MWFDKALVAAELSPMTIRELRHTTASLAVSAGANVKAVQRMLGHASPAMTLDVYTYLLNDDLDHVAHRLDEAVSLALDDVAAPPHPEANSVTMTDRSDAR
ncbi:tyrosine-type recombinase/integrase [Leifsonia xyli]|uniref:tyrosine-type recombinase/integrase n=1 Tax=Leifsonia xyli TaxID=1575 RepID=UPI003D668561